MMNNSFATITMVQHGANRKSPMETRRRINMLFSKTMGYGKQIMFLRKLFGKQNKLQALSKAKTRSGQLPKHGKTIANVALNKIVGSEGRIHDFDKHFRPLVNHIRDRWVGIAIAYDRGTNFPPVELIQVGDEYYVRDGHHRISVAKTFGQVEIEAKIIYALI